MKIYYDAEVDAMYIEFIKLAPGTAKKKDLSENITGNFDSSGKPAGIEIIDISKATGKDLHKLIFEISPAAVNNEA